MAAITDYKHRSLSTAIDSSVKRFEKLVSSEDEAINIIADLKNEQLLLEEIFEECQKRIEQLRKLNNHYLDVHKRTRIKLRHYNVGVK
jgi:hypothetical protein